MSDLTTDPAADAPRRSRLQIPVDAVAKDGEGFVTRSFIVRLPQDAGLQDVIDLPTVWRTVQGSPLSMRKLDRVTLIAWDESWVADCIVSAASDEALTLSKPVKTDLASRASIAMPEDDTYRVVWMGRGFNVQRKADGQIMRPDPFSTLASATRFMDAQRPRRVA